MIKFAIILFTFLLSTSNYGQEFKAQLINLSDLTPMPFAIVKLVGTEKYSMTNANGEFKFSLATPSDKIQLKILFVACHQTISHKIIKGKINKVMVNCKDLKIEEVLIEGLSARQILEKAVDQIPNNYGNSSYVCPSFYRQYKDVNGKFKNYIEAETYVMFNLERKKQLIHGKESVALSGLRRSKLYITDHLIFDDFTFFMEKNFVYHVKKSSLNKNAYKYYEFSMDTSAKFDEYIINYICKDFTSEDHGIGNRDETGLEVEGWERGSIVIDAKSFAFINFERFAYRNKDYNYHLNNNCVLPERKFFQEFIDGYLKVEYKKKAGKWYLDKLLNSYTNEFYRGGTGEKTYVVTAYYEWYAHEVVNYISKDLADKLYFDIDFYDLDSTYTNNNFQYPKPDFHFIKKEVVLNKLVN